MKYIAIMTFLGVLGFSLSANAIEKPWRGDAFQKCVKQGEREGLPIEAAEVKCVASLTAKCTVKCTRFTCKKIATGKDCLNHCRQDAIPQCNKVLQEAISKRGRR